MNYLFLYFFLQTKKTANWLTEKMTRDGHAVGLLSGELQVEQRVAVLKRYRDGKEKVLITTNVMARGERSDFVPHESLVMYHWINGSQLAKMKKSIPDMSLQ